MKTVPKIFVVDDNFNSRTYLVNQLKKNLESNIVEFTTLEDCIDKNNETPSYILWDYYIDGAETKDLDLTANYPVWDHYIVEHNINETGEANTLEKFKNRFKDIPFFIYSSKESIDSIIHMLKNISCTNKVLA